MTITSKPDYVVWRFHDVPNSCVLDELSGIRKRYQLREGVPRAEGFPSDAKFTLDPDYPNDTLLVDAFDNVYRMVVISPRLQSFLADRNPMNVEFLPVTIIDHKGRPKEKYFILHPVHPVDCIDLAASAAKWDTVNKDMIESVDRLVLKRDQIDPKLQILKMKFFVDFILVRHDLADAITAEGFTGIRWVKVNDFHG